MEKLHISTPELDERNLSYDEFFRLIHAMLRHKTYFLQQIYPSKSINDLDAYPLIIVEKIIKIARTFYSVSMESRDYVSSNILMRSLADVISSLFFIYGESDPDIKKLRHYLFIMDGLQGRLKNLPTDLKYDGRIKEDEFKKLKLQIENAIENYGAAYECAIKEIHSLTIYSSNHCDIDKLITDKNWKFKVISSSNKNSYSWNELYRITKLCPDSGFFSLLSEFVHGLSTSNLLIDSEIETFEPLLSITSSLLGKTLEFIDKTYIKPVETIKDKLFSAIMHDVDIPSHYIEGILHQYFENVKNQTNVGV